MVKQISDNEIYLLNKYIKSILWRVAKRLSHIEDAQCVKVIYYAMLPGNIYRRLERNLQLNHLII